MPKFRVLAKTVEVEIYHVIAPTKEEAMFMVEEEDERAKLVNTVTGDTEIYYPDIEEIFES